MLASCGSQVPVDVPDAETKGTGSRYLSIVDDEPETTDPQCTTEYYTIPLNVYDRLVEVKTDRGERSFVPSLAASWEISDDGLTYTFHLREGVKFSNGSPLTSDDVKFTFERLLTHEESVNQDLVMSIQGADALRNKRSGTLEGFEVLDDLNFRITLAYPYGPFLANLSTAGASILDKETVTEFGDQYGKKLEATVGTGAFQMESWTTGEEIILRQNPNYWGEKPGCDGLQMMFLTDTVSLGSFYEVGQLDILDLEYLGNEAEYYIHGDIYRKNLVRGPRVGITYVALNESIKPLDDVRVRKAMQLSLNRNLLMQAMVGGRGNVENGIFPYGLLGHNRDLATIPYDLEEAKSLLEQAGYGNGFDFNIYCTDDTSDSEMDQLGLIASMWEKVGIRTTIVTKDSEEYLRLRKAGKLSGYVATWSADFNDPDNFIYTFFGTEENSKGRSLCYSDKTVMERIEKARSIVDEESRIKEYQDLEKKIVQEDAAWIPLYSRLHLFVVSDRVEGFEVSWNGWSSTDYRNVSIKE